MKTLYKRITNFTFAAIIAVSALAAIAPAMFASTANAAPGLVYQTTPDITSLNYGADRTAPSGGYDFTNNALNLHVNQSNASANPGFYRTEGVKADLSPTKSIEATLKVDANWANNVPVRAGLWGVAGNGSDDPTDVAWPIIEFTNIGEGGFSGFRVFDTMNNDWTNLADVPFTYGSSYKLEIAFNAATKSYDYYVNDTLAISKTAVSDGTTYGNIQGVIFDNFNSATNDSDQNYTVTWNDFETGSAPVTSECVNPSTLLTTDINTWDTTRTRANGHNEIVAGGLHVFTDGNDQTGPRTDGLDGNWNTDKAAGYFATDYKLSDNGNQSVADSMDYTNNVDGGLAPGLQLLVDFDNDPTDNTITLADGQSGDGFLVGEAVYGTNAWWLSEGNSVAQNGAPHSTGGVYNTPYYGTIDEWLGQFPDARVNAIGYSLGSGAHGDGYINRITLGCVNYVFDLPATPETPVTTVTGDNSDADGSTGTTTTSTSTTPTPAIADVASVLGATDNGAGEGSTGVAGATDDKTASIPTDANGTIFGLMWYWWILIIAALGVAAWAIIAAIRRRNNES